MTERRIEVMVFEGCPNIELTLERARAAITDTNVAARVLLVHVRTDEDAKRQRFLGSPTVRVDGADVDSSANHRDDFGMQCRIYSVGGHLEGAPPTEWIAAALRGETTPTASPSPSARGGCCASNEVKL